MCAAAPHGGVDHHVTMSEARAEARVIEAKRPLTRQVTDIWRYRDLLLGMVRKELKVKYKNSVLGFVWSMLNPAMYLVVFWVVFTLVLRVGIPKFAIFFLAGLIVWNLFSSAIASATSSITANSSLVQKVYLPREVLPLASVGAALVHFFLQSLVLFGAVVIIRHDVALKHMLMLPPALLTLLVLLSGVALMVSAFNVYLRDVEHLVELGLLVWFWMTPIVYQFRLVADRLGDNSWVAYLNPLTTIVVIFQRAIYNVVELPGVAILPNPMDAAWYVKHLGAVGLGAVVVLLLGLKVFGRLEGNFAEEL